MKIQQIISNRWWNKNGSFDIVHEWEDQMAKDLSLPIMGDYSIFGNKYVRRIPLLYHFATKGKKSLVFDMYTNKTDFYKYCNSNIVPIIIDFFETENQIGLIEKAYKSCKVVFISSKEAYEFLKEHKCKLNIEHLPLSLPDKYAITKNTHYDKDVDVLLIGRPNKVLLEWIKKYIDQHPKTRCAFRSDKGGFVDNFGQFVGNAHTRELYLQMLRRTNVALYSTPGMDKSRKGAQGYNQVTPRFLELLASGCQVIARYPDNPDTEYYELGKITPHTESYEMFEEQMNRYLSTEADMGKYSMYLKKHYTSYVSKILMDKLQKIK